MQSLRRMNAVDKVFYKALKYFATHQTPEILDSLLDEKKKKKYHKHVSKIMHKTLQAHGYITFNEPANYLLTPKGMQFLRELEEIRRKEITLISSAIAVVISLIALGFSIASYYRPV